MIIKITIKQTPHHDTKKTGITIISQITHN